MGQIDPLAAMVLPNGAYYLTLFLVFYGTLFCIGGVSVGIFISFRRRDEVSGYIRRAALGVVGGFALWCTIIISNSLFHQFRVLIEHDNCNAEQMVFSDKQFLTPISTIMVQTRPLTCVDAAFLVLTFYLPFLLVGMLMTWFSSRHSSERLALTLSRLPIALAIWLGVGSSAMLLLFYIDMTYLLFRVI